MTSSFDRAAQAAPKVPDLTCQHIDGILDSLSDIKGLLDWVPMDQGAEAHNIAADLADDEGPLERLREMNSQLRRSAAYWKKVAREQSDRLAELESEVNWTHVNR
jgi:hypothetical protein